jgi:hypothetical protein
VTSSRVCLGLVLCLLVGLGACHADKGVVGSGVGSAGFDGNNGGQAGLGCAPASGSLDDPAIKAVLDATRGHHTLGGTWQNGRQGTVMSLDVTIASMHFTPGGCGDLMIDATATVATKDGVLSATGPAVVGIVWDSSPKVLVELSLPALPDAFAHPAADADMPWFVSAETPNDFGGRETETRLTVTLSAAGAIANMFPPGTRSPVGVWSTNRLAIPARRAPAYVVPTELAADCAAAATLTNDPVELTPFPTEAAAKAAMTGTWIRCRAFGGLAHAGLQISADGSWRHLTWDGGALVTGGGLGHEGTLGEARGSTNAQGLPGGSFLVPTGGAFYGEAYLAQNRLFIGYSWGPPGQPEVYVLTERAVKTGPVNLYAKGARGGQGACAVADLGSFAPKLGGPIEAALVGEWTVCDGDPIEGYARVRFDGHGAATFLDEMGRVVMTTPYELFADLKGMPQLPPPPYAALNFTNTSPVVDIGWDIYMSERPLKLLVGDTLGLTSIPLILSALP